MFVCFLFRCTFQFLLPAVYLRMQYVRYNNSFNIRYECIGAHVHVVIVGVVGGGRRCNIHLRDEFTTSNTLCSVCCKLVFEKIALIC